MTRETLTELEGMLEMSGKAHVAVGPAHGAFVRLQQQLIQHAPELLRIARESLWTHVDDALPEIGVPVLIACDLSRHDTRRIVRLNKHYEWEGEGHQSYLGTHWMRLPDLPPPFTPETVSSDSGVL